LDLPLDWLSTIKSYQINVHCCIALFGNAPFIFVYFSFFVYSGALGLDLKVGGSSRWNLNHFLCVFACTVVKLVSTVAVLFLWHHFLYSGCFTYYLLVFG